MSSGGFTLELLSSPLGRSTVVTVGGGTGMLAHSHLYVSRRVGELLMLEFDDR